MPAIPPPAWVTTSAGRVRLAYSSYCWNSGRQEVCADAMRPSCGERSIPTIPVRRGELLRFNLGFRPKLVSLEIGTSHARALAATRTPTWRATRAGVLLLFADAGRSGDVSYAGCVVFRR